MNRMQIITTLLGLIISGEAVALIVGVWVRHPHHPWLLFKNKFLILTDVAISSILIMATLTNAFTSPNVLFTAALFILLSTHLFRVLECIGPATQPFCFNKSLYCVNLVKSFGLFLLPMVYVI